MSTYGAAVWSPTPIPARPAPRPSVTRLTRRGRLTRSLILVVLLAAVAVLTAGRLLGSPARAAVEVSDVAIPTATVTVEPGDSLWLIAQTVAPQQDPRDMVVAMRELNGLVDNTIHPGQTLLIPTR